MLSAHLRPPAQQNGRPGKVTARDHEQDYDAHPHATQDAPRGQRSLAVRAHAWLGTRQMWRRCAEAAYSAFTVGGVLVVPLTAVLAIIGTLSPGHTPLHEMGSTCFGYGALWFIIALCGTHLKRTRVGKDPAH